MRALHRCATTASPPSIGSCFCRGKELTEQVQRCRGLLEAVRVSRVVDPTDQGLAEVILGECVLENGHSLPATISSLRFVGLLSVLELPTS